MMRRGEFSLLLLLLVAGSMGCAMSEPLVVMRRYTKNIFSFRGSDYSNPTEEEDDPWITQAANEGRADQARERDPDQWYKKYLMSEKARSIERNLGFD